MTGILRHIVFLLTPRGAFDTLIRPEITERNPQLSTGEEYTEDSKDFDPLKEKSIAILPSNPIEHIKVLPALNLREQERVDHLRAFLQLLPAQDYLHFKTPLYLKSNRLAEWGLKYSNSCTVPRHWRWFRDVLPRKRWTAPSNPYIPPLQARDLAYLN